MRRILLCTCRNEVSSSSHNGEQAVAYVPAFSEFSNVHTHLDAGKFVEEPTPQGILVTWVTTDTGIFGDENEYVQNDVKDY